MSFETAMWLLLPLVQAANYAAFFLMLPLRYGLRASIAAAVLFSVLFIGGAYFYGKFGHFFGKGFNLLQLPFLLLLITGSLPQKIFSLLIQLLVVGLQISLVAAIVNFFEPQGSDSFRVLFIIAVFFVFAVYLALLYFHGRYTFQRIFIDGQKTEWGFYALGAVVLYLCMLFTHNMFRGPVRIIMLLFIAWNVFTLCFAIINTHEKYRHKYESEFARDIISLGSEHYQKMDELYHELRLLRHDYQYHLNTIGELLNSGNIGEIKRYLTDLKAQLSSETLPGYCSNTVINALLASYAGRCAKLGIDYNVTIDLPQALPAPNFEMCIILGNFLENAVAACQKLTSDRKIEVKVKPLGAQLVIMVKNTFLPCSLLLENEEIISSKEGGGSGLLSVRTVAARHGGELITEWDESEFTAYVTMML